MGRSKDPEGRSRQRGGDGAAEGLPAGHAERLLATAEPVLLTDSTGCPLLANASFHSRFGSLPRSTWLDLVDPVDRAAAQALWLKAGLDLAAREATLRLPALSAASGICAQIEPVEEAGRLTGWLLTLRNGPAARAHVEDRAADDPAPLPHSPSADDVEAALDRLALRLHSPALRLALDRWRSSRGRAALPSWREWDTLDASVASLAVRLGPDHRSFDPLTPPDASSPLLGLLSRLSLDEACRRAAHQGQPVRDSIHVSLGAAGSRRVERLVLPFGDGVTVDRALFLVAVGTGHGDPGPAERHANPTDRRRRRSSGAPALDPIPVSD